MTTSMRQTRQHPATACPAPDADRVLIVDDEPAIQFAYKRLIEREGVGADGCASLEEAAELIRTRAFRVIIADLRLSGTDNQDGMEVLRLARKAQPEAKVILVTGYGSLEIRETALALGAAHFFEKPVMPVVIMAALFALLGREAPADGR